MSKLDENKGYLDGLKELKIPLRKSTPNKSLLKQEEVELKTGDTFNLSLERIKVEKQVRHKFDHDKLMELAKQLATEGQRYPLEVAKLSVDNYLLITGERRFRALSINQAKTAKVTLIDMPSDMQNRITLQLTENLQRDNLTALELAGAFDQLKTMGVTQAIIAEKVGKSEGWVSRYLSLIGLPTYLKALLEEGHTSDTMLIGILRKIDEISIVASSELADKIKKGTATRQSVTEAYNTLKALQINNKAVVSSKHKKTVMDLDKIHYKRNHRPIQSEKFNASVEAKLTNGKKIVGQLLTTRLAEMDNAIENTWCWVKLADGTNVCVETSTIRINSVHHI